MVLKAIRANHYNRPLLVFTRDLQLQASKGQGYVLDPAYQRGSVWSLEQKRNLIRSLFLGIPIGVIFLNRRGWHDEDAVSQRVIDGKQRLEAIRGFVAGEFEIPGEWVDSKSEWVKYADMHSKWRWDLDNSTISTIETDLKSEAEERDLFNLVNYGGTPHTDEDRRRAEVK